MSSDPDEVAKEMNRLLDLCADKSDEVLARWADAIAADEALRSRPLADIQHFLALLRMVEEQKLKTNQGAGR